MNLRPLGYEPSRHSSAPADWIRHGLTLDALADDWHQGVIAMAWGPVPTLMAGPGLSVAVGMGVTVFES
jgi:hypothetical protein